MERRPHPSAQRRPDASRAPQRRPAPPQRRPASRRTGSTAARPTRREYRTQTRIPLTSSTWRLRVTLVAVAVVLSVCAGRLLQLQVLDTNAYAASAAKSAQRTAPLPAQRGTITDRNGVTLAASEPAVDIIADPRAIDEATKLRNKTKKKDAPVADNAREIAELLAEVLGGSVDSYLPQLRDSKSQFKILTHRTPAVIYRILSDRLREANLGGIFRQQTSIRSYPAGTVAGNVVGFVDGEGKGAGGFEYKFNRELAGTPGIDAYEITHYGRLPQSAGVVKPAVDGTSYQLTIDSDMQATADLALQQAMDKSKGDWGVLIVQNPQNGEILAMSQSPSYDPADSGKTPKEVLGNRAVTSSYEPGSVLKVLSWAAYADAGIVTPDTKLTVPASLESGGHKITDAHDHGTVHWTGRGAFSRSSNIATAQLARQLGRDKFVQYMMSFGLGNKSGIELPGEASGKVNNRMADYTLDRAAFGQSMTANAVQMATAVSAAVNGGIYNPPTIIRSATGADGKPVDVPRRESHRVISPEASAQVRDMMEAVVTQSVKDKHYYGIDGYRLIGKTGTAQRSDPKCGCYRGTTASYVGVGPTENPSVLVYLVIDNPKVADSGHAVAVPYVRDLMRVLLPHYGVPLSTQPGAVLPRDW